MLNMLKEHLGFFAVALLLASCGSQPKHINQRVDEISSLEIMGGPVGASVYIDGVEAWRLQGKNNLSLSDGQHDVRVVNNGTEIYRRTILVKDGTHRVIKLP